LKNKAQEMVEGVGNETGFQPAVSFRRESKALPWAGMRQAFGLRCLLPLDELNCAMQGIHEVQAYV